MLQALFQLLSNSVVQLWNENQISFLINILAGGVTALIAYHFRQFIVFLQDQKFRKYRGNYDVYEKYKEGGGEPVFNFSIKVKLINFRYEERKLLTTQRS